MNEETLNEKHKAKGGDGWRSGMSHCRMLEADSAGGRDRVEVSVQHVTVAARTRFGGALLLLSASDHLLLSITPPGCQLQFQQTGRRYRCSTVSLASTCSAYSSHLASAASGNRSCAARLLTRCSNTVVYSLM